MNKYYIIETHYKNDNTSEYGYGDYPKRTDYIKAIVYAETKRKAQNMAKKEYGKGALFGGMFGLKAHEYNEYTTINNTLNKTGSPLTDTFPTLEEAFTIYSGRYSNSLDLRVLPNTKWKQAKKEILSFFNPPPLSKIS